LFAASETAIEIRKERLEFAGQASDLNALKTYYKEADGVDNRRPKTSMMPFNSVSRELNRSKQERSHSRLLQRNICMSRRSSQLVLQGQIEK